MWQIDDADLRAASNDVQLRLVEIEEYCGSLYLQETRHSLKSIRVEPHKKLKAMFSSSALRTQQYHASNYLTNMGCTKVEKILHLQKNIAWSNKKKKIHTKYVMGTEVIFGITFFSF